MSHEAPSFPLPVSARKVLPPTPVAIFDWLRMELTDDALKELGVFLEMEDAIQIIEDLRVLRDAGQIEGHSQALRHLPWLSLESTAMPQGWWEKMRQVTPVIKIAPTSAHVARALTSVVLLQDGLTLTPEGMTRPFRYVIYGPNLLLQAFLSCEIFGQEALRGLGRLALSILDEMPLWEPAYLPFACVLSVVAKRTEQDEELSEWFQEISSASLPWHTSNQVGEKIPASFVNIGGYSNYYDTASELYSPEEWRRLELEVGTQ